MSAPDKPFGVEDVRPHLEVLRQRNKDPPRWVVCHKDSRSGIHNPQGNPSEEPTINRIIGVAVLIVNKDDKILVGERDGSHGAGTWALPGGHIDDKAHPEGPLDIDAEEGIVTRPAIDVETEDYASAREVKEETGIKYPEEGSVPMQVVHTTWDFFEEKEEGHGYYNTFFTYRKVDNPKVVNKETDKCKGWEWKSWEELREMWHNYPVVEDEEDGPAATAAKKKDAEEKKGQTAKLFLPLAKLVRDFEDLDKLRR